MTIELIEKYKNIPSCFLDRTYNTSEAKILARGRMGGFIVDGNKKIGPKLALEIGVLTTDHTHEEVIEMIKDEIKIYGDDLDFLINNSCRAYNSEFVKNYADDARLSLWNYEGTLIKNSRPFCRRLLELPYCYTEEQILKMDNGVDLNPFAFRGGFDCRHGWSPGEEGWPGFKKPYPKDAPFETIVTEKGLKITVASKI